MNTDSRIPPLINALKLVAADFNTQIAALPSFVVHADEVALDFDDAYQRIALTEGLIPEGVMQLLRELDVLFAEMSNDRTMWTQERMRDDGTWARSRELARAALNAWGIEPGPPKAGGTYVKG